MDSTLDQRFEEYFFEGKASHVGSSLMSAIVSANPKFGRFGNARLPLAHQSLQGWKRLTPGFPRLPEPEEFWALLALVPTLRGQRRLAQAR